MIGDYPQMQMDIALLKMAGLPIPEPQPVSIHPQLSDYPQYRMDSQLLNMAQPQSFNPTSIEPPYRQGPEYIPIAPNDFKLPPSSIMPPQTMQENIPISPNDFKLPGFSPEPQRPTAITEPYPERIGDGILRNEGKKTPFGDLDSQLVNVRYGTKPFMMVNEGTFGEYSKYAGLTKETISTPNGNLDVIFDKDREKEIRPQLEELKNIYKTFSGKDDEHRRIGELLGYTKEQIDSFISPTAKGGEIIKEKSFGVDDEGVPQTRISVQDNNGKEIGDAVIRHNKGYTYILGIEVKENMRRQGIGTKIIDYIKNKYGKNIDYNPDSIEGEAFFKAIEKSKLSPTEAKGGEIWYHGTPAKDLDKIGFKETIGYRGSPLFGEKKVKNNILFVSEDFDEAKNFGNARAELLKERNFRVYPIQFSPKKTFDMTGGINQEIVDVLKKSGVDAFDIFPINLQYVPNDNPDNITITAEELWQILDNPDVVKTLKDMGYDSVRLMEDSGKKSLAILTPENLKFLPSVNEPISGNRTLQGESRNKTPQQNAVSAEVFKKGDKVSYIWREGEKPQEVTISSKEPSDLAYGKGKGWKIKLPDGQNIWVSEKQLSKLSPREGK